MAWGSRFYRKGLSYSVGKGVPQDLVRAHMWLNLAATAGEPHARELRAEIARDMTAAEIAEAQRQAREFLRTQSGLHVDSPTLAQ